ncbi:uncharacterized protein [Nicotiana tomentosiformis]|uniref:uncharacterized protein n=1 Tax=Nicotiana tomentosiformis TaxID=4098 RepID=UPI00388C5FBD
MVERNDEMEDLYAMLSECSLVGNPKEWWIDSEATHNVCDDKELFASYVPAGPNETIFMGNSAIAKIEGVGKIDLKMTSGKVVTLNNVLHVPEIRKNLVSTGLLIKNRFKCIFVSEKVVIRYARNSKAYRFLVHKSENPDIHINTVIESDNVEFFENIYPYKYECKSSIEKSKRPREEENESTFNEENPRSSKHQRTTTSFGPDFLTFLLENEPQTFKEAMSSSEAQYWKETVNSEIESILSNHTWELVDLPPENKPLGVLSGFSKGK